MSARRGAERFSADWAPAGLRLLVVDPEASAGEEVAEQLRQCGFCPVLVDSAAQAERLLRRGNQCHSNTGHSMSSISGVSNASSDINEHELFDILLVDSAVLDLGSEAAGCGMLLAAARTTPLVLMSSASCPDDIVAGIKLGAVDHMQKPLYVHKLRNIWQHTVRRVMHQSGSHAFVTNPCEDMATVSMDLDCDALALGDMYGSNTDAADGSMELDDVSFGMLEHALESPSRQMFGLQGIAPRPEQGAPPPRQREPCKSHSSNQATSKDNSTEPVLGYPAGRLPELTTPGMVWGLPTNPLRVTPRPPIAHWPPAPMMASMLSFSAWNYMMMQQSMLKAVSAAPQQQRHVMPPIENPFTQKGGCPEKLQVDASARAKNYEPTSMFRSISKNDVQMSAAESKLRDMLVADAKRDCDPSPGPISLNLRMSQSFLDLLQQCCETEPQAMVICTK
mmetsp:Transcript_24239/g.71970  ORF Transcript_24239/g.71970 Transcript_24239/m.71970 type:complete len:450 (-) Transcript_24239:1075-2424(-)